MGVIRMSQWPRSRSRGDALVGLEVAGRGAAPAAGRIEQAKEVINHYEQEAAAQDRPGTKGRKPG